MSPSQKYEIWLQLVRQETTISEAADRLEVNRSTIMRIREVARQGALEALATSKPGTQPTRRDLELEAARAEAARLGETLKELAASCCWLMARPALIKPGAGLSHQELRRRIVDRGISLV